MKADHERVKALLAESITVLCKNGLQYRTKFTIQGLLGITLDDEDVFLVDIHEKVGETTLPGLGDKRPGSPGEKSPRREHGSRRKKRRRKSSSQSDVSPSRSASPAPDDFEETIRKEPTVSNENPTQTTVVGDCGNKQTNNPTIVSIEDHSSVEQILELAKDIPPWAGNGNEDDMISTDAGAGTCSSGFNSASENPDGATSSNIIVKTEEDDEIVFVKQEQSDSFPSHTRTRSDEMFPGGSFQGPANNPQTDFLAQGPFQHPQPFPPLPDQSFTQGPGTSQSDSFQRPEDSAGSDIPSGSQAIFLQRAKQNAKKRPKVFMSLVQKKELCLFHKQNPHVAKNKLRDIFSEKWGKQIGRTTITDTLNTSDRWLLHNGQNASVAPAVRVRHSANYTVLQAADTEMQVSCNVSDAVITSQNNMKQDRK